MEEPEPEQLMVELRKLQEEKRCCEAEVSDAVSVNAALSEELLNLETEAFQLNGIQQDKEETCRVLQLQCRDSEQDFARQLQLNKQSKEMVEQHRCQIQEVKLEHRKLRMEFEDQLHQLMEQHKNLHSVMKTIKALPSEVQSAENSKCHLLAIERRKKSELHALEKEVSEAKEKAASRSNLK